MSEGTEEHIRIMVTSRQPHALLTELSSWLDINTDELSLDPGDMAADSSMNTTSWAARDGLDPEVGGKVQIWKKCIGEQLNKIEVRQVDTIIQLIQEHTGWPHPSPGWPIQEVFALLDGIGPGDGVAQVLDRILRRYSMEDGFTWIMSWLIATARPFTQGELAELLSSYFRQYTREQQTSESIVLDREAAQWKLDVWLRGLVDIDQEQVKFRSNIRDIIFDRTPDQQQFLWQGVEEQAHQTIVKFCIHHFQCPAIFNPMQRIYEEHRQRGPQADGQKKQMSAPLTPDGVDVLFYLIQFLPFHLARCPPAYATATIDSFLTDPNSGSEPSVYWARLYWAMTNPFLRPPGIWEASSAWPTFIGLELLPIREGELDGDMNSLAFLVAAFANRPQRVSDLLQLRSFSHTTLTNALVGAVSAGNEETAKRLAECVIESNAGSTSDSVFPSSLIWATAWLDLASIARILLQNGSTADPVWESSDEWGKLTPSPLYLASALRHPSMVKLLLDHGARVDVVRDGKPLTPPNFLVLHPQLWREFCEHDSSYLRLERPLSLFHGTATWGSWWSIPSLLENENDVDIDAVLTHSDYDTCMTPLVSACFSSYIRTAQSLLQAGADANKSGPWSPLWLATVWSPNPELLKSLLHYNADPNHEQLERPLLYELVISSLKDHEICIMGNILLENDPPVDINAKARSGGQTALMGASGLGRLALVTWLLSRDADPSILDDDEETALHYAVRGDRFHVAQQLISRYPDLVTAERAAQPLLILGRESPEMVRLLLDSKADPERSNYKEQTVINTAAVDALPTVMEILLERKANLHHRDKWGATPICDAVEYGQDIRVLRLLIDYGANLDDTVEESGNGLLHLGVNSTPEILRVLLEYTKSLNLDLLNNAGRTALLAAGIKPNIECLKLLINAGADVNLVDERGESALHNSIHWQLPALRDLLLSQRDVEVNISSPVTGSPLHLACRKGQLESVTALLDCGADVHQLSAVTMYCNPLVAALLQDKLEQEGDDDTSSQDQIVRTLINHGADVGQIVRGSIYSPLAAACFGAGPDCINLLLDEGAQPDDPDPISGRLPLHFAAANGIHNFQVILHAMRSDPIVTDRYGKSALHWAAQYGHVRTVEHILSLLTSSWQQTQALEQEDSDGWTPLCWAVRPIKTGVCDVMQSEPRNYPDTVRLLLDSGADRSVRASWGDEMLTPLEMAQRCGAEMEVIELLQPALEITPVPSIPSPGPFKKFTLGTEICDICLGVSFPPFQLFSCIWLTIRLRFSLCLATNTGAAPVQITISAPNATRSPVTSTHANSPLTRENMSSL